MTDLSPIQDDDYIVVVNAQVMTRDENKGGWVPLGRGGLSRVGLVKRPLLSRCAPETPHEYRIHGVLDQSEVLNCVLTKDVKYVIANPTFIHWHIEDKRFGLTFQSSRDAKAFERGVQQVVEDLLQDAPDKNANTCILNLQFPHTTLRYKPYVNTGEEEGVFMALELPIVRKGSGSTLSTTTTTTTSSPQSPALHSLHEAFPNFNNGSNNGLTRSPGDEPVMHKVVYLQSRGNNKHGANTPPSSGGNSTKSHTSVISSDTSNALPEQHWIDRENKANERARQLAQYGMAIEKDSGDTEIDMDSSSCSYVQFNPAHKKVPQAVEDSMHHVYTDPFDTSVSQKQSNSPQQSFSQRPQSFEGSKRPNPPGYTSPPQPPLPTKTNKKRDKKSKQRDKQNRSLLRNGDRAQCKYCDETFCVDDNRRGACEDAPDRALKCINCVSCICCAHGVLYHCVSKEENYEDPYACDTSDENHCKKWTILTILTLFVPCLWCYCLLRSCHRCGSVCGCCGARHKHST